MSHNTEMKGFFSPEVHTQGLGDLALARLFDQDAIVTGVMPGNHFPRYNRRTVLHNDETNATIGITLNMMAYRDNKLLQDPSFGDTVTLEYFDFKTEELYHIQLTSMLSKWQQFVDRFSFNDTRGYAMIHDIAMGASVLGDLDVENRGYNSQRDRYIGDLREVLIMIYDTLAHGTIDEDARATLKEVLEIRKSEIDKIAPDISEGIIADNDERATMVAQDALKYLNEWAD